MLLRTVPIIHPRCEQTIFFQKLSSNKIHLSERPNVCTIVIWDPIKLWISKTSTRSSDCPADCRKKYGADMPGGILATRILYRFRTTCVTSPPVRDMRSCDGLSVWCSSLQTPNWRGTSVYILHGIVEGSCDTWTASQNL